MEIHHNPIKFKSYYSSTPLKGIIVDSYTPDLYDAIYYRVVSGSLDIWILASQILPTDESNTILHCIDDVYN